MVALISSTGRGRYISSIRYERRMGGQMDGRVAISFRKSTEE